jgi:hypothetical protein
MAYLAVLVERPGRPPRVVGPFRIRAVAEDAARRLLVAAEWHADVRVVELIHGEDWATALE